ncbi:MAG: glycosyltransferase [Isosphaeraceae bacterium]
MDLTAAMTLDRLNAEHAGEVVAERVCPPFLRRASRLPVVGRKGAANNIDRLMNRLHDYPRYLRGVVRSGRFDLYHLADHSYSQLLHVIPRGRGVVTCHDLDTFRCLFDPEREPRPRWFRAMARHILNGLTKAAGVACNSAVTRDELIEREIVVPCRAVVVPMGTHPECSPRPDPAADAEAARLLGPPGETVEILHVGSNIPRKRIDVLLKVFAEARKTEPDARLIKVGGAFPPHLAQLARELGVADAVVALPFLTPATLAAVYRRATLVLLPSESEGFGLPAAEALACGAILLASDIPALREVAAPAAELLPVGDVAEWSAVTRMFLSTLHGRPDALSGRREVGLSRARRYTWSAHAEALVTLYRDVLGYLGPV